MKIYGIRILYYFYNKLVYPSDPYYDSTKLHIYRMIKKYGEKIFIVNLVKLLGKEGELA